MSELKKLTGRPVMKSGKRVRKIDARFTQEEYDQILSMEKELGISKTELLRMRLLNEADKVVLNSAGLIGSLDKVGAEMGRIGNNINQLARYANKLNLTDSVPPAVVGRFNMLLDDYVNIQRLLETSLRKIIQIMGK